MPAPYDTALLDNATDVYEITVALNDLSNGLLAGFLLAILYFFFLIIFRNSDNFANIMLGTSFVITVIGLGLWGSGLLSVSIMIFPVISLMISIFIKIWGHG